MTRPLTARGVKAMVSAFSGGTRWLLMVERGDGYGWAVPGGHVEPGEPGAVAALRELREETGLADATPFFARQLPPRYVPDPRSSDEAWAVTIPLHVNLGIRKELPGVTGGDDARRAEWVPARTYGVFAGTILARHDAPVFPAHVLMLTEFIGKEAP